MKRVHLLASLLVLTGCAGLIGVPDLSFDENAVPGSDGGADGSTNDSGPPGTDGGTDGSVGACAGADLQTDAHHCGRCNHDCLGGACSAGTCKSVVLKNALANPTDIAFDASNVYVTTRVDGSVLRIPKTGAGATALATAQTEARGVTLDGTNLFWSNGDFSGDGTDGYVGGVWGCTLPACSDKHQVTKGDKPMYVRFSSGRLFFAENNAGPIVSVKPNGAERTPLTGDEDHAFSISVDAQHVYYDTWSGVRRVPVNGGAVENIDTIPITSREIGLITSDADRVYYAYFLDNGDGRVYSAKKSDIAGPKEQYGTANKGSLGVAVDATTLYWTNAGTFSGDGPFTNNKDGEVLACPKSGCGGAAPVTLETGLLSPGAITVDGDAIYFVTFGASPGSADGELRRIAKP